MAFNQRRPTLYFSYKNNAFRLIVGKRENTGKKKRKMRITCNSTVCVCQSLRLFVTPWTVARQAPLSMGFSRQEPWSGLPFPPPGELPDPGIEPRSPALWADALRTELRASVCDHWENRGFDYTDLYWQSDVSAFEHAMFVTTLLPRSQCLSISRLQSL